MTKFPAPIKWYKQLSPDQECMVLFMALVLSYLLGIIMGIGLAVFFR